MKKSYRNISLLFASASLAGLVALSTSYIATNNIDKLKILTEAVMNSTVDKTKSTLPEIVVKAGSNHAGAIIDGQLYMWGNNDFGQLGDGTAKGKNKPTLITMPGGAKVTYLELGAQFSGAIAGGKLYTWGRNHYGQLGDGKTDNKNVPTEVPNLPAGTIKSISFNNIDVDSPGCGAIIGTELYTWGVNTKGQLGLGHKGEILTPSRVETFTSNGTDISYTNMNVIQVAFGKEQTKILAYNNISKKNEVFSCGANNRGVAGVGNADQSIEYNTPVGIALNEIPTNAVIQQISASSSTAAVVADGKLYMWGNNVSGQMSDGVTIQTVLSPILINKILGTVTQVDLGDETTAVIMDKKLWMWGAGYTGNNEKNVRIPKIIEKLRDFTTTQMDISTEFNIVVSDGLISAIGRNRSGELGIGNTETQEAHYFLNTANFYDINKPIIIDSINDLPDAYKFRNQIHYNVIDDNFKWLLTQYLPMIAYNVPIDAVLTATNLEYTTNIKTSENSGQLKFDLNISKTYVNNISTNTPMNISGIIIKGFSPVSKTEEAKIFATLPDAPADQPTKDLKTFELPILIEEANNPVTAATSRLKQWIFDNQKLIISDTSAEYSSIYPKNTKIVDATNFAIINSKEGKISFKISLDKYYEEKQPNILTLSPDNSTPVVVITPASLGGLKKTSESSVNKKQDAEKGTNLEKLIESFSYVNDTTPLTADGIIELKKYINLVSFPDGTEYYLTNVKHIDVSKVEFKVKVNKYYDADGLYKPVQHEFDFQFITNSLTPVPKSTSSCLAWWWWIVIAASAIIVLMLLWWLIAKKKNREEYEEGDYYDGNDYDEAY